MKRPFLPIQVRALAFAASVSFGAAHAADWASLGFQAEESQAEDRFLIRASNAAGIQFSVSSMAALDDETARIVADLAGNFFSWNELRIQSLRFLVDERIEVLLVPREFRAGNTDLKAALPSGLGFTRQGNRVTYRFQVKSAGVNFWFQGVLRKPERFIAELKEAVDDPLKQQRSQDPAYLSGRLSALGESNESLAVKVATLSKENTALSNFAAYQAGQLVVTRRLAAAASNSILHDRPMPSPDGKTAILRALRHEIGYERGILPAPFGAFDPYFPGARDLLFWEAHNLFGLPLWFGLDLSAVTFAPASNYYGTSFMFEPGFSLGLTMTRPLAPRLDISFSGGLTFREYYSVQTFQGVITNAYNPVLGASLRWDFLIGNAFLVGARTEARLVAESTPLFELGFGLRLGVILTAASRPGRGVQAFTAEDLGTSSVLRGRSGDLYGAGGLVFTVAGDRDYEAGLLEPDAARRVELLEASRARHPQDVALADFLCRIHLKAGNFSKAAAILFPSDGSNAGGEKTASETKSPRQELTKLKSRFGWMDEINPNFYAVPKVPSLAIEDPDLPPGARQALRTNDHGKSLAVAQALYFLKTGQYAEAGRAVSLARQSKSVEERVHAELLSCLVLAAEGKYGEVLRALPEKGGVRFEGPMAYLGDARLGDAWNNLMLEESFTNFRRAVASMEVLRENGWRADELAALRPNIKQYWRTISNWPASAKRLESITVMERPAGETPRSLLCAVGAGLLGAGIANLVTWQEALANDPVVFAGSASADYTTADAALSTGHMALHTTLIGGLAAGFWGLSDPGRRARRSARTHPETMLRFETDHAPVPALKTSAGIAAMVLAGAGNVFAAESLTWAGLRESRLSVYSNNTDPALFDSLYSNAYSAHQRYQLYGGLAIACGSAALITGILYFALPQKTRKNMGVLMPVLFPGYAGLRWTVER